MAHFRGWIAGKSKTKSSRLGSKQSGLLANLASWQGAVEIDLTERDGVDYVRLTLKPHVNGAGCHPSRIVYDGPISGGI